MNIQQIVDGIKSGGITVNPNGHQANDLLQSLEDSLDHNKEMLDEYRRKLEDGDVPEKNDWDKTDGEGLKPSKMLELYEAIMDREIRDGDKLFVSFSGNDIYCLRCGEYLLPLLFGDRVEYMILGDYHQLKDTKPEKYKVRREDLSACPSRELAEAGKMVVQIDVPSGSLVFQNFFRKDKLYEKPYERGRNDINALSGRHKLMQYLAGVNVGYGQMGNMIVDVWSNERDEVLVTDSCIEDLIAENSGGAEPVYTKWYTESDHEVTIERVAEAKAFLLTVREGGFKLLGTICLDVWRWMCCDRAILKENGESLEKEVDRCIAKVAPGRYEIEHYYDFFTDKTTSPVYSRIRLVKAF